MTPEKALAILEGKIPRREPPEKPREEKKPSFGKPAHVGVTFIKVFSLILIVGVVAVFYMWRHTLVSAESYKRGFHEGGASMGANLALAQKEIASQGRQITHLQQDLGKSNDNVLQLQQQVVAAHHDLDVVNQQNERLSKILKATRQSIPRRIRGLKEELRSAQKALQERAQSYTAPLRQQIADIQQDLKAALQQREALQKDVDDLERQLGVAQSQIKNTPACAPPQSQLQAQPQPQ